MWNGFVNALKNAVKSVTSGWSAPKVSAPVKNVPSVKITPVQQQKISTPSFSAPSISKPSVSTPTISKPSVNTNALQQSGIKINLPSSYSPASVGAAKPVSVSSLPKPTLQFQGLSATAKSPNATGYQKALADLVNIGKGAVGLIPGMNVYSGGGDNAVRNLAGGTLGAVGTLGTQTLKQFAPLVYSGLQNATGKSNPFEFNLSEMLSAPVMGQESTLKPIKTNTTPVAESSGGFNMKGGQWYGDTWVSNEEMARRNAEADAFRKTGRSEVENLKLINPKLAQLQSDYQSGKINFNDYDAQVSALLNLGAPLNLNGLNTGTTAQAITPSLLTGIYDKAKLFSEDPTKTGQSNVDFYNNEANSINKRIEDAVNNVIRRYESGQMSVDDANREIADAQKRELYAARDRAVSSANSDLGILDKDTADYLAQEDTQLKRYQDQSAQQSAQQGMTYDEMLKRAVKNAKLNEGNLRNVFAAAGTAESSDFQDRLMNLSQETGAEQGNIERQKAQILGNISKDLLNQQADSNTRVSTFKRTQEDKKNQILQAIRDLSGSTDDKIFSVMADLASKTASGKQNLSNQIASLYSGLLNNYTNQQNTALAGTQNKQLLLDNYQATNDLNNIQSGTYQSPGGSFIKGYKRPTGAPSDLWDTASQMMQSGVNSQAVMNYLKQQAQVNPAWGPWIGTMDTILGTSKAASIG